MENHGMGGWGLAPFETNTRTKKTTGNYFEVLPNLKVPQVKKSDHYVKETHLLIQKQLLVPWRLQQPTIQKCMAKVQHAFSAIFSACYQGLGMPPEEKTHLRFCDSGLVSRKNCTPSELKTRLQTKAILGTSIIGHLLGRRRFGESRAPTCRSSNHNLKVIFQTKTIGK